MDLDNNVDISVDISANIIDDNVKLNIQEVSGNTVAIISNALENFDKLRMTNNNQSTTISSPIIKNNEDILMDDESNKNNLDWDSTNFVSLGMTNVVRKLSRNNTLKQIKEQTLYGSEEDLSERTKRDSDNYDSEYMGSDGSDGSDFVGSDIGNEFNMDSSDGGAGVGGGVGGAGVGGGVGGDVSGGGRKKSNSGDSESGDPIPDNPNLNPLLQNVKYKKLSYNAVKKQIAHSYEEDSIRKYSSALDILASYLKGQKIIYMESRNHTVSILNKLMLPAIFLSALSSVIQSPLENVHNGNIILWPGNGNKYSYHSQGYT